MADTSTGNNPDVFEFEKVSVADARKALEDGGPAAHASTQAPAPAAGQWDAKRRTGAEETLSPETSAWIGTLPANVRPKQLALRYPRLANRIGETWRAPLHCLHLLDGLMTDDRGGRQGFPLAVATELATLRNHCYRLYHKGNETWDHVEMGR